MGMAASQARLLCITARIHDVEYQAQSIQNAKIQLATQEDKAYREYNAALDATTLTINTLNLETGEKSTVPVNFNNLCSQNRLTAANGKNYAIRDNCGRLIVEDEIENVYNGEGKFSDAYAFALYMLGEEYGLNQCVGYAGDDFNLKLEDAEEAIFNELPEPKGDTLKGLREKLQELTSAGSNIYDKDSVPEEKQSEYEELLDAYKKSLYSRAAADINNKLYTQRGEIPPELEDFNTPAFNYYVSIYNQIEACGGCVSIKDFDGFNGDAANDNEWLQAMVESGQFSIELIKTDSKTGDVSFDTTSVSSDSCIAYTQTSQVDNRALAKAEAEYEHKLKQIDKKDQRFDLDLSKLETERKALTTEYDSVKKVIEDNIDRTFGIFS